MKDAPYLPALLACFRAAVRRGFMARRGKGYRTSPGKTTDGFCCWRFQQGGLAFVFLVSGEPRPVQVGGAIGFLDLIFDGF